MEIIKSNIIPEVIKIKPTVYKDDRGSFVESFRYAYPLIYDRTFVQDNVSFSKGNVLRGLHYQKERSQENSLHVYLELYLMYVWI